MQNINYKIYTYLCIFGISIIFLSFPKLVSAAKLYITPPYSSYYTEDFFTVEMRLDSEGESINAAEGGIQFSPETAEIVGIDNSNSIFSLWIEEPAFDNERGLLSFSGGTPSPGFKGSDGIITAVTFRTKKNAQNLELSFQENSRVLLDDGSGKEAVLKFVQGVFSFLEKPAEFLRVSSPTHGDQTKWYNISDVEVGWGIEKRDIAFSYILDKNPDTQPDTRSEGVAVSVEYRNLQDGIWYFHIKKLEVGRWSDPVHFKIQIDTQPPSSFLPKLSKSDVAFEGKYFLVFSAEDELSGVDRYEAEVLKEWQKIKSPYVVARQAPGEYTIKIRAYDKAGNFKDVSASFVIPKKKLKLSLSWLIILIVSVILLAILYKKIKYGAKI